MSFFIYANQSDEVGAAATVTLATGTADTLHPVTKVQTYNPADAFLTSSSGTAVDILWDHGSAVDVKLFSLTHHNIPAGTNVRIQRNATNSWGAPTVDGAVTIATFPNAGLPLPVGIDVTSLTGYNGGTGFRYTRLHIPSLAQKVGVGSALLWGAKRTDIKNIRFPLKPVEDQRSRTFETAYGSENDYRLGIRLRGVDGTIRTTNTDFPNYLALFRAAQGRHNVFLFWLDATNSDAWLSKFGSSSTDVEYAAYNNIPCHVVIKEVACGVALPTV
jgi:hypothetical protein